MLVSFEGWIRGIGLVDGWVEGWEAWGLGVVGCCGWVFGEERVVGRIVVELEACWMVLLVRCSIVMNRSLELVLKKKPVDRQTPPFPSSFHRSSQCRNLLSGLPSMPCHAILIFRGYPLCSTKNECHLTATEVSGFSFEEKHSSPDSK
jgi:hypothetical protein